MATSDALTVQSNNQTQLNNSLVSANDFLNAVKSVLVNIAQPNIDPLPSVDYSAATANLYNLFTFSPPTYVGGVVNVPLPTAPTLAFDAVGTVTVPEFAATPPLINIVAAPDIVLPALPSQPTITDIALPTAPTITLPTAPVIGAVSIPLPPSLNIPSFTSTLPTIDFLAPTNTFSFAEVAYSDALLDAEKAKLLADLENGGYGIEPLDETAMWNRAREREFDSTQTAIDEIYRATGARGFPLPPADVAVSIDRALQSQQDKMSSISREIAIKRADMFVENRKFTISEVRQLEQILMNYWNSVQERALNAAKATLDAAIAIYETQVKRYNVLLEGYRVDAQVFETKIRAVNTQVEIYKAQIQAAQVTADVQRILVETYNAQLKGVEAVINIYRIQMEAANIASQVQRTKIEAFSALIGAYTAQVQSQVAVQNAYEAKTRGELAKAQVFETQARAYSAQVEGAKVRSEILINTARAQWEQANAKVAAYRGQLEGADINLKAQLGVVSANIQGYEAQTRQYLGQLGALGEQFKLDELAIQNSREIQVKQADVQIETAKLRLTQAIQTLSIQAEGLKIGGSYYSGLLQSLAATIQAIATVSS